MRATCDCGCGGTPKTPGAKYLPGHNTRTNERANVKQQVDGLRNLMGRVRKVAAAKRAGKLEG